MDLLRLLVSGGSLASYGTSDGPGFLDPQPPVAVAWLRETDPCVRWKMGQGALHTQCKLLTMFFFSNNFMNHPTRYFTSHQRTSL